MTDHTPVVRWRSSFKGPPSMSDNTKEALDRRDFIFASMATAGHRPPSPSTLVLRMPRRRHPPRIPHQERPIPVMLSGEKGCHRAQRQRPRIGAEALPVFSGRADADWTTLVCICDGRRGAQTQGSASFWSVVCMARPVARNSPRRVEVLKGCRTNPCR